MTPELEALLREADQWERWFMGNAGGPNFHLLAQLAVNLARELRAALADSERIDFIERSVLEHASGSFEMFPVGAKEEFADDGNTVTKVGPWRWLDAKGDTFRAAIDAARAAEKPKG